MAYELIVTEHADELLDNHPIIIHRRNNSVKYYIVPW